MIWWTHQQSVINLQNELTIAEVNQRDKVGISQEEIDDKPIRVFF